MKHSKDFAATSEGYTFTACIVFCNLERICDHISNAEGKKDLWRGVTFSKIIR